MDIFFTLLFGIAFNWVLLLFSAIASVLHKHRMGVFICGIIVQGIAVFGIISGMIREPNRWTEENIFSVICFMVISVAGIFIIRHTDRNTSKQDK